MPSASEMRGHADWSEDVPLAVELGDGGPARIISGGCGGDLRRRGRRGRGSGGDGCVGGALASDVTLDGDGELGELGVADDLAELLFGFEQAGGRPAQAHVAVVPVLDVARDAA